jgi:hypothetical protein
MDAEIGNTPCVKLDVTVQQSMPSMTKGQIAEASGSFVRRGL